MPILQLDGVGHVEPNLVYIIIPNQSRPPYPHAAALMAHFLMSKRGQDIMYSHGRWVGHKSIIGKGSDNIGERNVVIPSPENWGDRY